MNKPEQFPNLKPKQSTFQESQNHRTISNSISLQYKPSYKLRDNTEFKCKSHFNTARAVCAKPTCNTKLLCAWDIRTHPHASQVYYFSEISDPNYLVDVLSLNGQSLEERRKDLKEQFSRIKSEIQVLVDEFEVEVDRHCDAQLREIETVEEVRKIRELQEDWLREGSSCSLGQYVKALNSFFFEIDRDRLVIDFANAGELFSKILKNMTRLSDEIRIKISKITKNFREVRLKCPKK